MAIKGSWRSRASEGFLCVARWPVRVLGLELGKAELLVVGLRGRWAVDQGIANRYTGVYRRSIAML